MSRHNSSAIAEHPERSGGVVPATQSKGAERWPHFTPASDSTSHRAAWRALAEPLSDADAAPLRLLADGAAPSRDLLNSALATIRRAYPHHSLLALRAVQTLTALPVPGDPTWAASIHLCLAEIHAFRREPRQAEQVAAEARRLCKINGDAGGTARCDVVAGQAALTLGRHEEAERLLTAGYAGCLAAADRIAATEASLALAHLYTETARPDQALAAAAQAQAHAGEDAWLVWRSQAEVAEVWLHQTQYLKAAEAFAELADRCQATGWRLDYGRLRLAQGLTASQQGDLAGAEAHLLAALDVFTAEATAYLIAVCRRGLGMLDWRTGRYARAEEHVQGALQTLAALDHPVAVGRCYQALGLIYYAWNRYDEALAAYDQAWPRFAAAQLPREQLAIRVNQALIYEERGYYHAALERYEQALAESRALKLPNFIAQCLDSMAMLNGRLGRYAEAVELYRQARRYFRQARNTLEAPVMAARQAALMHLLGQEAPARRLLSTSRRFFRAADRRIPLAFCELTVGEMAVGRGQLRRGLTHYAAALAAFEESGQATDAAVTRLLMGEAHLAAGRLTEAAAELAEALGRFVPAFPDLAGRAEHALGQATAGQGQARAAAQHWQRAVEYVTQARQGIVTESHAGSFYASRRHIYEAALDGWLAVDAPAEALAVAETSKGQVLAALLQQRELRDATFSGQSAETRALWERAWQVGRELEALRARWPATEAGGTRGMIALSDALAQSPRPDAGRLARLADEQTALFGRIRRSAASFDLLDPALPFSLARLRATAEAACGPGWNALAYYLRRDRLTIFWVTAGDVRAWSRSLSKLAVAKLGQAVDPRPDVREAVYAGRLHGYAQPDPPGERLLRSLADLLIPAEVRERLASDRRLLIAPHGLLHYLPFQALILANGRPLLEHATVSYAPTLRVWEALQGRQADANTAAPPGRALICGLGEFGARAAPLIHAGHEAHHLAGLFGVQATLLEGPAATHARIQQWSDDGDLAGFDIVHLATHARFDGDRPLQSGILLADGAVTVPDLFRLRLNARLVTLSACQTALSALEPGDELLGLREALLYAGAGKLLVSLWAVDDASTGRLMGAFYEQLLDGLAPVAALAAAQRGLLADGEPAYNWAPFVVIG